MNKLDYLLLLYTLSLVSLLSLGALTSGFSTLTLIVLLLLLPLFISLTLDVLRAYYIWKYRHAHAPTPRSSTPRHRLIAFFLASLLLGTLVGRLAFSSPTTANQIALEQ
jgi:hypothetical protein